MLKTRFLLFVALSAAVSAIANDNVDVKTSSGSNPFDVGDIAEIKFSDEGITVVKSDDSGEYFLLEDVASIVFESGSSSLHTASMRDAEALTVFVSRDGNSLSVFGWDDANTATLRLYGLSGISVKQIDNWRGAQVDISDLPHGIYILDLNGKSAKIRK